MSEAKLRLPALAQAFAGCERRTTYIVVCALGSPSCFAAASQPGFAIAVSEATMMNLRTGTGLLATTVLIIAGGCAGMSVSTIRYPNVQDFPPTDPASVQILRREPARPHQRLGEITVDATGSTAAAVHEVDETLRMAAAKLGADAVVLVVNPLGPAGAVASRAWWGTPGGTVTGRDVIGVAIRYR